MIPDNLFTIFAEIAGMVKALELKAIAKQITATIQILSGLGPVLAVAFPKFFNGFLGRIASWFKIDLSILFGVGCYAVNSYVLSLFINFATSSSSSTRFSFANWFTTHFMEKTLPKRSGPVLWLFTRSSTEMVTGSASMK